ncbi:nickel-dependent hydrogenase large subunit [Clostridium beijerinckii]|uniref:Periplasmic [NiFeSe] hydrogenase large subunit n=1 Tax=Clostridium beijerinckii TaxID=1520 RepID=A0A1S8SCU8_CLOBE|nr:nickel-dependent hydrogenase large subunit [Clostridium beijerinckii]NRY63988.1 hydrogenase large subunit [Clostridium beijerinckii]OOM63257.1 periplasmic [NiFeSe] hydrogenase large subunit [Clostridium beijerinckii]
MGKTITIDPVTRISGFLEIKAEVEGNTISKANASGLLFRGFEKMLIGRSPLDAVYFTERICGICSTAHSMASTLALEDALKVTVSLNDNYIRDILHGFEFIQNHLRHFYLLSMPSYVKISNIKLIEEQQYTDYRLPDKINKKIEEDYVKSIELSRLAHEGLALLGGKAPHNHGIFVGGVTVNIDAYKLEKVKSIIRKIESFVKNIMKEDVEIISKYYSDYFKKGQSYPYFMTYGVFDKYEDPEITYVKPGVMKDNVKYPLEPDKITEQIHYSWYKKDEGVEEVDLSKLDAYTFIKAPRYLGLPMEVGPLARLIVSGQYTNGHSCMDRNIARVLETEKIIGIMNKLIERVELKPNNQKTYNIPEKAYGAGLTDTTRGALGHWIEIDKNVINHYNIITPTVWHLSPKDESNLPGTIEGALIGTKLNNIREPIEIGRIVRSFDPCVSCATHLIGSAGDTEIVEVLV